VDTVLPAPDSVAAWAPRRSGCIDGPSDNLFRRGLSVPFINGKFYMNPAYGRSLEDARASEATGGDHGGHWVTINGRHVLIPEETPERRATGGTQTQKSPIRVSVTTAQEPQIVQNLRLGKNSVTGIGAQLKIRLSDERGKPLAGISVSENNKQGGVQNPDTIKTDSDGTIKDWVIRAGPSASMPGNAADLKDYVNTHPITVTSTQTLTVAADDASYEVTWTRTLTNVGADGKLNTRPNSHGVNFTVTWTSPQIKAVSR
jgi:hypothetical protein